MSFSPASSRLITPPSSRSQRVRKPVNHYASMMDSDDIEVSEGEDDKYGVEVDEDDESYGNTKKGKEGEDVEGPSGDEDDDVSLGEEEEEEDDKPPKKGKSKSANKEEPAKKDKTASKANKTKVEKMRPKVTAPEKSKKTAVATARKIELGGGKQAMEKKLQRKVTSPSVAESEAPANEELTTKDDRAQSIKEANEAYRQVNAFAHNPADPPVEPQQDDSSSALPPPLVQAAQAKLAFKPAVNAVVPKSGASASKPSAKTKPKPVVLAPSVSKTRIHLSSSITTFRAKPPPPAKAGSKVLLAPAKTNEADGGKVKDAKQNKIKAKKATSKTFEAVQDEEVENGETNEDDMPAAEGEIVAQHEHKAVDEEENQNSVSVKGPAVKARSGENKHPKLKNPNKSVIMTKPSVKVGTGKAKQSGDAADDKCESAEYGNEENDNKEMAQAGSIRENIVSSDEVGEINQNADEAKMEMEEAPEETEMPPSAQRVRTPQSQSPSDASAKRKRSNASDAGEDSRILKKKLAPAEKVTNAYRLAILESFVDPKYMKNIDYKSISGTDTAKLSRHWREVLSVDLMSAMAGKAGKAAKAGKSAVTAATRKEIWAKVYDAYEKADWKGVLAMGAEVEGVKEGEGSMTVTKLKRHFRDVMRKEGEKVIGK